MNTKQLGNSDLSITPLGLGTWAIGGSGWEFAWGQQDDRDSILAIREALDAGVNWIDTAAVYGLGHSEEIVARALEGVRQKPYVFTKCSMVWNERGEIDHSLKADSVRRECESSLNRLRVDRIDLYQVHWPNPGAEIEEGWTALARLKEEGKIRHLGVSNFSVAQMKRCQAIAPVTSLQPPYSLLDRRVEAGVLPFAAREHIGIIAYSPMASGLLTGAMTRERIAGLPADDWRKSSPNFREPLLTRNLGLIRLLRDMGVRHGYSPAEVAVAWVLRHPAVTGAIVGARKPGQFKGVAGASRLQLNLREIDEIDTFLSKSAA